jgi:hypothetical protein
MGFSKSKSVKQFQVGVSHPLVPDTEFVFTFLMSESDQALKAHRLLGSAKDQERQYPLLVDYVSAIVASEPTGFDEFPSGSPETLSNRTKTYFLDNQDGVSESILQAAVSQYWIAKTPVTSFTPVRREVDA